MFGVPGKQLDVMVFVAIGGDMVTVAVVEVVAIAEETVVVASTLVVFMALALAAAAIFAAFIVEVMANILQASHCTLVFPVFVVVLVFSTFFEK